MYKVMANREVTRRAPGFGIALLALVLATEPAMGQARLVGRVVDSETGQAIQNANVTIRGHQGTITTDSAGQFVVSNLTDQDVVLTVRRLGYAPGEFRVRVPSTGSAERVFGIDFTGQQLAAVEVSARAEALTSRYTDFERRRTRGLGAFFRWEELNKGAFSSVGDALRTVRGVRMQCNQQTFECFAVMVRSPQCHPVWYIDGQEARAFNENTPIRDVYGIEIYRGASEVPGEYSGSNAGCGVILLWTKSRPYRTVP